MKFSQLGPLIKIDTDKAKSSNLKLEFNVDYENVVKHMGKLMDALSSNLEKNLSSKIDKTEKNKENKEDNQDKETELLNKKKYRENIEQIGNKLPYDGK